MVAVARHKMLIFVFGLVCVSVLIGIGFFTYTPPSTGTEPTTDTQATVSNFMLPEIPEYNVSYSYRDEAFQETSGNDAAVVYCYRPLNSTSKVVWVAVQIGNNSAGHHRWEESLINYPLRQGVQPHAVQLDLRDVQLQDNPPVSARYFAYQDTTSVKQTEVILYWYQTATFSINGASQTKSVMISLVVYANSNDAQLIQEYESVELPIATAINNYLQPLKTWYLP
jgi:hypothetical protein